MANRGLRDKADNGSDTPTGPRKTHRLLRPKRLMGIAALFVVVFLGWGYNYTQTPAEGVVRAPTSAPQTKAATATLFEAKTFSLDLPDSYKPIDNKNNPVKEPTLEQQSFAMQAATESRRVGITVKRAPPAILAEDSAYAFRKRNQEYAVTEETVADNKITKMTKKDGSEITYFIAGNTAYAIIAATSSSPKNTFPEEITEIINSFEWKP